MLRNGRSRIAVLLDRGMLHLVMAIPSLEVHSIESSSETTELGPEFVYDMQVEFVQAEWDRVKRSLMSR